MIKRNKCEVEGCNSLVWKQKRCQRHQEQKPLPLKPEQKQKLLARFKTAGAEARKRTELQMKTFLEIWDDRCDDNGNNYCFETGRLLKQEYFRNNSSCYHHCLFKEKYPEYRFLKENVVILHPDVHAQVHVDIDKTPKTKKYTLELRNKLLSLE